jgi:uncharacterized protein YqfB (UPF0267 family)
MLLTEHLKNGNKLTLDKLERNIYMAKYEITLEGTVTLDAADELEAEDKAMDLIHGDLSALVDTNADLDFLVTSSKELTA